MGSVTQALFGGSSNKSSSSNKAWDVLKDPLTSMASGGANVFNNLVSKLGSFDDYKKNAGFDYQLNQGFRDTAGTAAANGLLNSGSTSKALARYETNLGNMQYGNWLDKLGSAVGLGTGAAGTLVGAGGTSSGKGSSSNGILNTLFG